MTFSMDHHEILANYESTQLIKLQYKKHHGGEINTGKAREIAAAFTQARGYLESASTADRIVRPLLVYYAVLSFSRGLTLFLNPGLREAGLAASHGLSVEGWGQELSKKSGDLAALKIKINSKGTLVQLIEATNHESYIRNNSSAPNYITKLDRPASNAEITLGDLFARFPEITTIHNRWRTNRCAVGIWPQKKTPEGGMELRVDPPYTKEDVEAVFGDGFDIAEDGKIITVVAPKGSTKPSMSDVKGTWNIGTLVAMTRYPGGEEFSKIATAFIVSYALGMLVRYYPSHWIGILHNLRHNEAMPSLLAALKQIESDYPRLVVDFLERRPAEKSN